MTVVNLTPDGGVQSHIKILSTCIQKSNNHIADVNIHCSNKTIVKASRLMLACSSDFIKTILESDLAHHYRGLPHDLICPDFDSVALMKVLELISSGGTVLHSREASTIKDIQSIIKCLSLKIELVATLEEVGQDPISVNDLEVSAGDEVQEDNGVEVYLSSINDIQMEYEILGIINSETPRKAKTSNESRTSKLSEQSLNSEHDPSEANTDRNSKCSAIWNHFNQTKELFKNQCIICSRLILCKGNNMSSMIKHLRIRHPEQHTLFLQDSENQAEDKEKQVASSISSHLEQSDQFYEMQNNNLNSDSDWKFKRSVVWKYFVKTEEQFKNRCSICSKVLLCKGNNTTSMMRHLKSRHPQQHAHSLQYSEGQLEEKQDDLLSSYLVEQPYEDFELQKQDISNDSNEKCKGSAVWNYFNKTEELFKNQCSICNKVLLCKGNNTTSMIRHLKGRHPKQHSHFLRKSAILKKEKERLYASFNAEPSHSQMEKQHADDSKNSQQSIIWSYFSQTDESNGNQCVTCDVVILCPDQNTSSMISHLKNEHPEQFALFIQIYNQEKETGISPTFEQSCKDTEVQCEEVERKCKRSAIWNFFDKTDEKFMNQCTTCTKVLRCKGNNTTSMIRHLRGRHPVSFNNFLQQSENQSQQFYKYETSAKPKAPKNECTDIDKRTCPECLKVYSTKKNMISHHKIVHLGERPYQCNECGATFARLDCFKLHNHNPEKKFLCSFCGKAFGRESARHFHERVHRGDKRYGCPQCGKMFMSRHALAKHETVHTGEKAFHCKECGRNFAAPHQLKSHMLIHTGEKPYKCQHCHLRFRHLSTKRSHKCERTVGSPLPKEEPVEPSEVSFQCNECGDQFSVLHQLTSHIKTHTDDQP